MDYSQYPQNFSSFTLYYHRVRILVSIQSVNLHSVCSAYLENQSHNLYFVHRTANVFGLDTPS